MKKEGALLLSMDAKEPTACARAAKQLQCLLPEIMVAAIQGGRLRSESELLAVSYDEGKTWFFIDAHNPEDLRRLLPEVSKLLPLHGRKKPEFFPGTK